MDLTSDAPWAGASPPHRPGRSDRTPSRGCAFALLGGLLLVAAALGYGVAWLVYR